MGINIRPAKHGCRWDGRKRAVLREGDGNGGEGVEREEGRPSYEQFGIAVATWGIYKAPTYHVE